MVLNGVSGCCFFFLIKSSLAMRLIFFLMAWLIDKIVAFGIRKSTSDCWETNAFTTCNFSWSELTAQMMRFNGFFFFWSLRFSPRLGNGTLYQRNSATFIQNTTWKISTKECKALVALLPDTHTNPILYELIKYLQFLIINLCFLWKLLIAWILGPHYLGISIFHKVLFHKHNKKNPWLPLS